MRKATLERQQMDRFARYWERLYQAVPDARRQAAEAMGEAVMQDLKQNIQMADLTGRAKGTVRSWQTVRQGSRGGYAAVSPGKGTVMSRDPRSRGTWKVRQHTYKGKPVTARQVTKWLERGHGVGHRPSTNPRGSLLVRGLREGYSSWNDQTGVNYVRGRQFYSFTRAKAWEHARKAADKVLAMIADEVDF